MADTWSQQVSTHYHLKLPEDVRAWLDHGVWEDPGGAEFNQPQTPQQLLQPDSSSIWAGFMLPDMLPIISNDYGDWLCLRFGFDGTVREVLYWYHGGGDWIPYGNTLAEALLYDAAFRVMYHRKPEFTDPEPPAEEIFRAAEWAVQWIDKPHGFQPFWPPHSPPNTDPLVTMTNAGVAEVASRRDLILRHLESKLKQESNPSVAQEIGATWEPEFVSWIFDTALLPEGHKDNLSERFNVPATELTCQDWDQAEAEAVRVIRLRQDLGWAFDIAGWAAERRGDIGTAIPRYLSGSRASTFADESVKFRTHWFNDGYGKFSAARLAALRDHLPPEAQQATYLNVFWKNAPDSLPARLRDYWFEQADMARKTGRHQDAYRCYYNAGWDYGLQYFKSYHEVFDGLISSATKAGSPALATLAATHRDSLYCD